MGGPRTEDSSDSSAYIDFLPPPRADVPTGRSGLRVRPRRVLLVVFGAGGTELAGNVQLRGPIPDGHIPRRLHNSVSGTADITAAPAGVPSSDEHPMAAEFIAAHTQFVTGFYEIQVSITAPENLMPTNRRGRPEGPLTYSRNVWVDFDLQSQRIDGGVIHVTQRAVVVGDPLTLGMAYLFQFGDEHPERVRLIQYQPGRGGPASGGDRTFKKQFSLYFGVVKKAHGYLGLARNNYRLVQAARAAAGMSEYSHSARNITPTDVPQRLTRRTGMGGTVNDWFEHYESMSRVARNDVRVTMNSVMYGDLFEHPERELLAHHFLGRGPSRRLGRTLAAIGHVGNALSVIELGLNAVTYGERINASLRGENTLFTALRRMYHYKGFSLMSIMEIESFRQAVVTQQAEALEMLRGVPMAMFGFVPIAGWIASAAVGVASFVYNILEQRTQSLVRDYLEKWCNAWLLRNAFRRDVESRGYDQAFPDDSDDRHQAQRRMLQLSIRAKMLYDLKELVDGIQLPPSGGDQIRMNEIRIPFARALISWILKKERWYMHRDLVFGVTDVHDYFTGNCRDTVGEGGATHWVPVEFQKYFPIDCWNGDIEQFVRWYRRGSDLQLQLSIEWDRPTDHEQGQQNEFEIRFKNFNNFGFENIVWAYVFELPAVSRECARSMRLSDQDVFLETWAQALRRKIGEVDRVLETTDNFRSDLDRISQQGFRRREGEFEGSGSSRVAHVTRDGDGYVARCFTRPGHILDVRRNSYLFLLFTNVDQRIVYKKYYYVGATAVVRERHGTVHYGPVAYKIQDGHMYHGDRRHQLGYRGAIVS